MRTMILIALMTLSCLSEASAKDFFAGIDAKISKVESISDERLLFERYYRLGARLSVYALYCDFKNELGYSLAFHKLWVRTETMQKQAEVVFGGFQPAYNKFEAMRNMESLRYVEMGNSVCAPSYAAFAKYVTMSESQLRAALTLPMPGDL